MCTCNYVIFDYKIAYVMRKHHLYTEEIAWLFYLLH